MARHELRITRIEICDIATADRPPHHRARLRLRYDLDGEVGTHTANLLCKSALTRDAAPSHVREDLLRHGLGQLRRMPEVWLSRMRIVVGDADGGLV